MDVTIFNDVDDVDVRTMSRQNLAASALKSVPSWNLTPFWSVIVSDLKSELYFQDVARLGVSSPLESRLMSVSMAGRRQLGSEGLPAAPGIPRLSGPLPREIIFR